MEIIFGTWWFFGILHRLFLPSLQLSDFRLRIRIILDKMTDRVQLLKLDQQLVMLLLLLLLICCRLVLLCSDSDKFHHSLRVNYYGHDGAICQEGWFGVAPKVDNFRHSNSINSSLPQIKKQLCGVLTMGDASHDHYLGRTDRAGKAIEAAKQRVSIFD